MSQRVTEEKVFGVISLRQMGGTVPISPFDPSPSSDGISIFIPGSCLSLHSVPFYSGTAVSSPISHNDVISSVVVVERCSITLTICWYFYLYLQKCNTYLIYII
jgi:hypothetical protein